MQLKDYFIQQTQNKEIETQIKTGRSVLYLGLQGTARSYLASLIAKGAPEQKIIIVTPNLLQAQNLSDDMQQFLPKEKIHIFMSAESVAADFAVASPEALSERLKALKWIMDPDARGICLVPILGMKKQLTPPALWQELQVSLNLKDEQTPAELTKSLVAMGYEHSNVTMKPGEMSHRGDIVDFYPLDYEFPIRISLGFDEVERISIFDPNTQKSKQDIDQVTIIPAIDLVVTPGQLQVQAKKLQQVTRKLVKSVTDEAIKEQIITTIENEANSWQAGERTDNTTYFRSYFYPETTTLIDYLDANSFIIADDYPRLVEEEAKINESAALLLQSKVESGTLPPQLAIYNNFREAFLDYRGRKFYFSLWQKGMGNLKFDGLHNFQTRPVTQFYDQMTALKVEITAWQRTGRMIVVYLSNQKKMAEFEERLQDMDIESVITTEGNLFAHQVNIIEGLISSGIEMVHERLILLAENDIFHVKKKRRPRKIQMSNAERLQSYSQLETGDYVVHLNHGIGRFTGIETIEVAGVHKDYLTIIYADQASIHVPIDQIDLVQKYVSSEGKEPKLNKMGGTSWAKTKQKVSSKIEDIADELIELYAAREAERGYDFGPDAPEQQEFEDAFPYTETEDQLRSTDEIKKDMSSDKPMDRLLVGDVGFGKTEVAMRAIFKAVIAGKQAAFLCPTTVLAQQHYETLVERFADYPFEIGLLSRFRTKKQQEKTISGLNKGSINIVIGTHRVLSKDVKFLDLGMLVVDEEQRFGVKDKERLKALKENVDVLTLTATPIPRTLHMSMLGVRDLSVIETPPANRFPVQTFVLEQNMGAVRDAIEREIARDGQVFYLFNNVAQIEEKVAELNKLVPEARIAFAHGQMTAVELENIMMDFVGGIYDVLVTTTIIETGVDIPNANTLLVENSDWLGLSTLYQLRGRVGRSNRVAYGYFMYRPDKMLSEVSEKRLQALRDFTELGSGFKIAMRDLSIRGAGNLLGKQQHGFMNSVGFDLYSQMLREAVDRKRGVKAIAKREPVEIELSVDAYIPDSYIPDEKQKVEMYKRINLLTDVDAMWDLDDELMDRFGEPPVPVQYLLQVGALKSSANQVAIINIRRRNNGVELTFDTAIDQQLMTPAIFQALEKIPMKVQVKVENGGLVLQMQIGKLSIEEWLDHIVQFTAKLVKLWKDTNGDIDDEV